jgi:hypothetical protein
MGTRYETLVGEECLLGFRHLFGGQISDVHQMNGVRILDENFAPIHYINPVDISHVGLGSYQCTIPAGILNKTGKYYDVWLYEPYDGSG